MGERAEGERAEGERADERAGTARRLFAAMRRVSKGQAWWPPSWRGGLQGWPTGAPCFPSTPSSRDIRSPPPPPVCACAWS